MKLLTGVVGGLFVVSALTVTTASSAVASSLPAGATMATAAVTATHAEPRDVLRKKFDCKSPKGKKLSVSWGTGGNVSTTIYFNNHCDQKRRIQTWVDGAGIPEPVKGKCLTVNPHTKGKKKISTVGRDVVKVTSPKKC
ncbi:hypothetical protein ABGB14_33790 [Nonomuraea sp. B10E15]|uniref:hypothetical protein n=1 Tax=Nonomuraea sp. B10E15 TaxID=3153560 RepID=UPI00325C9979